MNRTKMVVANWKMNKVYVEGLILANTVIAGIDKYMDQIKVVLATPYIHLQTVSTMANEHSCIATAAQNCSHLESGAYTGEVSASMIESIGASYVIIGHSERRTYFNEDATLLHQKIDIALSNKLTPIFCCGEPLENREAGTQEQFVQQQIEESLFHLSTDAIQKIAIAYEPIWAIGTGKSATATEAQAMHAFIRDLLISKYSHEVASSIPLLYGGSCKPSNAANLFAQIDIDGALVGGASLDAEDFLKIVNIQLTQLLV